MVASLYNIVPKTSHNFQYRTRKKSSACNIEKQEMGLLVCIMVASLVPNFPSSLALPSIFHKESSEPVELRSVIAWLKYCY